MMVGGLWFSRRRAALAARRQRRPRQREHERRGQRRAAPLEHNGAGDDCARTAAGRSANSGVRPSIAARCRRRNVAGNVKTRPRGASSHHSTAPSAPERSACSAAQAASAALSGVTMVRPSSAMPSAASAGAYGTKGGAIHNSERSLIEGASSRSSPPPGAASSSSVSPAAGQPPPGSSASSAAWPLGCASPAAAERVVSSRSARHSGGNACNGALRSARSASGSAARNAAAALHMAADGGVGVKSWFQRHCEVLCIYTVF
jgi:hypothetical protein